VWIYADHGQEQVAPYPKKFGRTIEDAVAAVLESYLPTSDDDAPPFEMAAIGPVGYIYPRQRLDDRQCVEIAEALASEAGVPTVLFEGEHQQVSFRNMRGHRGVLPEETADIAGGDHPFLSELREDLLAMCRHPEAGQIVLLGWCAGEEPISFAFENGAHGGPGTAETNAFALLPSDVPAPPRGYFRAVLLRAAVQRRLNGASENTESRQAAPPTADREAASPPSSASQSCDSLRIVTYNVHSCIGLDGRMSPQRIARVLAQCDADVIALQELDVRRPRTLGREQAREIAQALNMDFHFFPTIRMEEEQYGDAILSRLPMRMIRSDLLPGVTPMRQLEPRGAIWVEVAVGRHAVQVITTHLGLDEQERLEQVQALLGPNWLGHPQCHEPVILCGDLNFRPRSRAYRLLAGQLRDAQIVNRRPSATFPSRWPLVRIDHIFVKGALEVRVAETLRTRLAQRASDHLPLIAELALGNVKS
jgi:endonuclease/exonuclease/phosphatase family metal-dependent hydrolase